MIALLLALAAVPAPTTGQATLQSCELTPSGWVCHYQMPPVTLVGAPTTTDAPAVVLTPVPPTMTVPAPAPPAEADPEAVRQARLIARCADASWLSLCLPDDRREAKRLKAAAEARLALRTEVTRLLSEKKCEEAVKAALTGGDMALAREARAFCAS